MKGAAIIVPMVAVLACGADAVAQTAQIDPVESPRVFREAALGYCAERIHGRPLIAHQIDLSGPDWVDVRSDVQTTGGQRIFAGRMSVSTGVIVDVATGDASCFVQINLATPVLANVERLRAEIMAQPGAVQFDEVHTPEGHGTIIGLIDPESDAVPIFAVNDTGPDGSVATVVVAVGSKGN